MCCTLTGGGHALTGPEQGPGMLSLLLPVCGSPHSGLCKSVLDQRLEEPAGDLSNLLCAARLQELYLHIVATLAS